MTMTPEDRWAETRKRLEPSLDALFWQDFGITDPEKKRSVDWILDQLLKPELMALLSDSWALWRLDDNGNHFKVKGGLSYEEVWRLKQEYESSGHKQFYWVLPTAVC
ncbi:hypothetical protein [Andreprevotia chitinilytica]|uniref:hypothetical protein n=1 Tax=Andreprevotia chitinilytica TaxID=396808 RepID=UPI0005583BDA|nr:hypothetical protein [Andreprevotia chitinilytica]